MRQLYFAQIVSVLFLTTHAVYAQQQFDGAFGITALTSPSISSSTGNYTPQKVGGGAFPSVSADFILKRHFGIEGEAAWRGSQNLYLGYQPYRPIFYDFNGIWAQRFASRLGTEAMAGLGGESVRFYQPYVNCTFVSCTNYTSNNHLALHVGGGLRLYTYHSIFVRPEAHAYFVHNNIEFSGDRVMRYGVSVGYTFAPGP